MRNQMHFGIEMRPLDVARAHPAALCVPVDGRRTRNGAAKPLVHEFNDGARGVHLKDDVQTYPLLIAVPLDQTSLRMVWRGQDKWIFAQVTNSEGSLSRAQIPFRG